MSAYESLDLYFSIANRIDLQWRLFITVHLALFGGIIYVDRPLRTLEKVGAILLYTGFATVNYFVMYGQFNLMSHLLGDISVLSTDECCKNLKTIQLLASEHGNDRSEISNIVLNASHGIMFLLATTSIIFDRALSQLEKLKK